MLPLMDAFLYTKRHFSEFAAGEKITVETEIGEGALASVNVFGQQSFGLVASGEPAAEAQRIAVKLTDTGFEVPLPEMQPGEFSVGNFNYAGTFYAIQPGKVVLEFEQSASQKVALMVGFFPIPINGMGTMELPPGLPPEMEALIKSLASGDTNVAIPEGLPPEMVGMIEKMKENGGMPDMQQIPPHTYTSPRLTAKRLFTCQTFHDLFRAEVFQESAGFGITDSTFLFTDLKSSTQLYQEIGDLNAFALVREHYGVLNKAILNQHGAAVKTIGDAIMATFDRPVDAVGAGLEMLREMRKMNQESHQDDLILKIGIHRGAAISVTLNERIDYFGQTVNIAARVQGIAGGDEIYMTDEIYNAPGVSELLAQNQSSVESIQVQLKGIEEDMKLYKTTALA
jgi:class 3 adenylate cyclase